MCHGVIATWHYTLKNGTAEDFLNQYKWCADVTNINQLIDNHKKGHSSQELNYNFHETISFANKLCFNHNKQCLGIHYYFYNPLKMLRQNTLRPESTVFINGDKKRYIDLFQRYKGIIENKFITMSIICMNDVNSMDLMFMQGFNPEFNGFYNHLIGFKKIGSHYKFFDPNHPKGLISVNVIDELVDEIFKAQERMYGRESKVFSRKMFYKFINLINFEEFDKVAIRFSSIAEDFKFIDSLLELKDQSDALILQGKKKYLTLSNIIGNYINLPTIKWIDLSNQYIAINLCFIVKKLDLHEGLETKLIQRVANMPHLISVSQGGIKYLEKKIAEMTVNVILDSNSNSQQLLPLIPYLNKSAINSMIQIAISENNQNAVNILQTGQSRDMKHQTYFWRNLNQNSAHCQISKRHRRHTL